MRSQRGLFYTVTLAIDLFVHLLYELLAGSTGQFFA